MKNILFWFSISSLKANARKFQFMIINRKNHERQQNGNKLYHYQRK